MEGLYGDADNVRFSVADVGRRLYDERGVNG